MQKANELVLSETLKRNKINRLQCQIPRINIKLHQFLSALAIAYLMIANPTGGEGISALF
jgi:hypothetical protein